MYYPRKGTATALPGGGIAWINTGFPNKLEEDKKCSCLPSPPAEKKQKRGKTMKDKCTQCKKEINADQIRGQQKENQQIYALCPQCYKKFLEGKQ